MSQALNIDWEHAKSLRLQGLTYQQIADKLGVKLSTVCARGRRHNWEQSVTRSREAVQEIVQQTVTSSIAERASSWKGRVINLVEKHLKALEKHDPSKLKLSQLKEIANILDQTDKTARRSLGLDSEDEAKFRMNMGLVVNVIQGEQGQPPAINIETT